MIEVYNNLYVGSQFDYESSVRLQAGWAIVHACKEPYHREVLGYKTSEAPKDHLEYLIAKRGHRLMLNLVDVGSVDCIPHSIIDEAVTFVADNLNNGLKVLIHCNHGMSRSSGVAMLFLASNGEFINKNFNEALVQFKILYPNCNLSRGMFDYVRINWSKYNQSTKRFALYN